MGNRSKWNLKKGDVIWYNQNFFFISSRLRPLRGDLPLMIANCLADKPLPVYGEGLNVRGWLYVEDHCKAIDPTKIHSELGWLPETKFADGIQTTIQWYLDNREWWETIISGEYQNYYEKMYGNR